MKITHITHTSRQIQKSWQKYTKRHRRIEKCRHVSSSVTSMYISRISRENRQLLPLDHTSLKVLKNAGSCKGIFFHCEYAVLSHTAWLFYLHKRQSFLQIPSHHSIHAIFFSFMRNNHFFPLYINFILFLQLFLNQLLLLPFFTYTHRDSSLFVNDCAWNISWTQSQIWYDQQIFFFNVQNWTTLDQIETR